MFFKKGKTVQWDDYYKGENVMFRFPQMVNWYDDVIVQADEMAIFFRYGKAMHTFDRPGEYPMLPEHIPILAKLGTPDKGKQIGEIYYIQRRELRGKFGTVEPLTFRDTDFGLVRIRVFGRFSYKVVNPIMFMTQFVGTKRITRSEEIINWLRSQVLMCVNDALGELKRDKNMAVVDMPAYLQEIEQVVLGKIGEDAKRYGLQITRIIGLNINLPEEVQKAIDKRGAMGALGVGYMQYQTGKAVEKSGVRPGAVAPRPSAPAQPPSSSGAKCPKCGDPLEAGSKFCNVCGLDLTKPTTCGKCGVKIRPGAKRCGRCGADLVALARASDLERAKNYEVALKYDDAIAIYDKYKLWQEAGRCRRLKQQMESPKTTVDIGTIDQSTKISDSVVTKSNIGGGGSSGGFSMCPYCGKDLNFPKPPKFCPYCREKLLH